MSSTMPSWVAPPPVEPGSLDPLGYQPEVESLANAILPGITVFTVRARYASFLCWAIAKSSGNPRLIDRLDVAMSMGEHLRHHGDQTCSYLGVLLAAQAELRPSDPIPRRLHTPSARLRYMVLLRSGGLVTNDDVLTESGGALAKAFDRFCPRSVPKRIQSCSAMPCLNCMSDAERKLLWEALLGDATPAGQTRRRTLREVGKPLLREAYDRGAAPVLRTHLRQPPRSETERTLHQAAVLECEALPSTELFYWLYRSGDHLRGTLPPSGRLAVPYALPRPGEDMRGFRHAMANHFACAARYKRAPIPKGLESLKAFLLDRHYRAKADGPWVDRQWNQLRKGLARSSGSQLHGYRLSQFASLLADLGEI